MPYAIAISTLCEAIDQLLAIRIALDRVASASSGDKTAHQLLLETDTVLSQLRIALTQLESANSAASDGGDV